MLRTLREDGTKLASESFHHKKSDWNRTPLAPIGSIGLAFKGPSNRAAWQPHATDAWYIRPVPLHYRLMNFFDPQTGGTLTTGTFRLYPTHCRAPTISEGDRIIAAAADLLRALKGQEPESAAQQRQHMEILKQLTEILHKPMQGRQELRVEAAPTTLEGMPSSSANPTHPAILRSTRRVHQQRTRKNNPYQAFLDERQAPQRERAQETSKGEEPTTCEGGRKTNTHRRKKKPRRVAREEYVPPGGPIPLPTFTIPTPKGAPPLRAPMVSQDDDMTVSTEGTEPLSNEESEEEEEPHPIWRSPRLKQNRIHFTHTKPAGISQAALTSFIGNSFMQEPKDIGKRAEELELEHVANGVVHPVTKETITNYKTLIKDPIMREVWMEAMAKELGHLAQGWGMTKGTNTIEFMSHNEIARIPKGKVVTYACIVVNF